MSIEDKLVELRVFYTQDLTEKAELWYKKISEDIIAYHNNKLSVDNILSMVFPTKVEIYLQHYAEKKKYQDIADEIDVSRQRTGNMGKEVEKTIIRYTKFIKDLHDGLEEGYVRERFANLFFEKINGRPHDMTEGFLFLMDRAIFDYKN